MKTLISLFLITMMCNSLATAIEKSEHGVKYRQSAYFMLRMNMAPLVDMVKSKTEYDADKFRYYAARVATLAQFPKDGFEQKWLTDNSAAKPEIWENKTDFDAKMQDLVEASQTMAEVSKTGDKEAMFNAFKKMGKTCKSCHDQYKSDDD